MSGIFFCYKLDIFCLNDMSIDMSLKENNYSSLLLLQYSWDKKKVSLYPHYLNIQYNFLLLWSCWDIDLVSQ